MFGEHVRPVHTLRIHKLQQLRITISSCTIFVEMVGWPGHFLFARQWRNISQGSCTKNPPTSRRPQTVCFKFGKLFAPETVSQQLFAPETDSQKLLALEWGASACSSWCNLCTVTGSVNLRIRKLTTSESKFPGDESPTDLGIPTLEIKSLPGRNPVMSES